MDKLTYAKVTYEEEFKRFTMILHLFANYINTCSGDVLIDLATAWEQYNDVVEDYPMFLVRKSGSDLITRYEGILKEDGKPYGVKECLEYCDHSLGWDFMAEIMPCKVVITNNKLDGWAMRDLNARLHDIVGIGDVEWIDREGNEIKI